MINDNNTYQSIKDRLRKIQALAEGGYAGEAVAAKRKLDILCREYGISIDDFLDTEKTKLYRFNVGRSTIFLKLFVQCYANITGKRKLEYMKISGSDIKVEMIPYQAAELANLFLWHKTNLKKDIEESQKLLLEAYIDKHHIVRDRSNDPEDQKEEEVDLSTLDLDHLRKVLMMKRTLNDNTYRKMIEK